MAEEGAQDAAASARAMPAAGTSMRATEHREQWYFRDREGKPQGPHSSGQMREWLRLGYLSAHVAVAQEEDGPYLKLSSYFPDVEQAFRREPRSVESSELQAAAEKGEASVWYFKDHHGAIQGPFSASQMREWAHSGNFDGGLQVRRGMGPSATFRPLYEHVDELGAGQVSQGHGHGAAASDVGSFRSFGQSSGTSSFGSGPSYATSSADADGAWSSSQRNLAAHAGAGGGVYVMAGASGDADGSGPRNKLGRNRFVGSKQSFSKTKLFSRVTKHRRSNSAGSSLNLQQLMLEENRILAGADGSAKSSPSQRANLSAAANRTKLTGKRLLSVVTTPKYASRHLGRYGKLGQTHRDRGRVKARARDPRLMPNQTGSGQQSMVSVSIHDDDGAEDETPPAQASHARRLTGFRRFKTRSTYRRGRKGTRENQTGGPKLAAQPSPSGSSHLIVDEQNDDTDRTIDEDSFEECEECEGEEEEEDEDEDELEDDEEDDRHLDCRLGDDLRDRRRRELQCDEDEEEDEDDVDDFDEEEEVDVEDDDEDEAERIIGEEDEEELGIIGADDLTDSEDEPGTGAADTQGIARRDDAGTGPRCHPGQESSSGQPTRGARGGSRDAVPLIGPSNITSQMHTLLNSFQAKQFAASFSSFPEDRHAQSLQMQVAELQDENSQLRAYIREMRTLVSERAPEVAAGFPPEPRVERVSAAGQGTGSVASAAAAASSTNHAGDSGRGQSANSPSGTGLHKGVAPGSGSNSGKQNVGGESLPSKSGRHSSVASAQSTGSDVLERELWEDFVVVEFDEDSPMLRRKMSAFEEGTEDLRNELKELIKTGCGYLELAAEELEGNLALADDLAMAEIRKLSPLMPMFHEMLKRVVHLKEDVLDSLQQNLILSFEDFLKNDVKQAQVLRRELQRARDVFETLEARYMHHRRTKARSGVISNVGRGHDAVEDQMFAELQAAKARFELARFGLIQQINQLESKKRFVLVDRVGRSISAYLDYFRRGYQMLSAYSVAVEESRHELHGSQGKFELIVEKWNEKRLQLESQLHSGAFPFMSRERRAEALSRGPGKVVVHSRTSRTSHDPLIIHEGYLYKRSSSVRKDWKRRWFVLYADKLRYYRGWKDPNPQPVCDMLLCTVREVKNPELRCCFEIISPNKRAYILQALNEHDMHTWMDAIRKAIETNLTRQAPRQSLTRSAGLADPEVELLLSFNAECADCGAAGPDWVSLNLGIVICIECSGIHRSLGTHISKVRSVALDQLPRVQLQLLRRLGNEAANGLLEFGLGAASGESLGKPGPEAGREALEVFIRAKYVERRFLDPSRRPENLVVGLFEACAANNVEGLLAAILHKAPLRATSDGEELLARWPAQSTVVHVAAASGAVESLELLLLSGAPLEELDVNGDSALALAQRRGHHGATQVLERYQHGGRAGWPSLSASRPSRSAPNSPVNPVFKGVVPVDDLALNSIGGDGQESDSSDG